MTRETLQSLANRLAHVRRTQVQPGDFYRHYRGDIYEVFEVGALEANGEVQVIFRPMQPEHERMTCGHAPLSSVIHIRPLDEFVSDTWTDIPGGVEKVKRFTRVEKREQWVEAR